MSIRNEVIYVILLAISWSNQAAAYQLENSQLVEKYGKAVVLVAAFKDKDDIVSQGSGFLVDSSGTLITNENSPG